MKFYDQSQIQENANTQVCLRITFTVFQLRAMAAYSLPIFSPDLKLSTTFLGTYLVSVPFWGRCVHACPCVLCLMCCSCSCFRASRFQFNRAPQPHFLPAFDFMEGNLNYVLIQKSSLCPATSSSCGFFLLVEN